MSETTTDYDALMARIIADEGETVRGSPREYMELKLRADGNAYYCIPEGFKEPVLRVWGKTIVVERSD